MERQYIHTGLLGMTQNQMIDFYERFKEWMKASQVHNLRPVMHIRYRPMIEELLDQLREDAWWRVQAVSRQPVFVLYSDKVSDQEVFFMDRNRPHGQQLRTLTDVFGNVGFGRFTKIAPPSVDGVEPFPENRN